MDHSPHTYSVSYSSGVEYLEGTQLYFIEGNRLISSIIVFFGPYFMPVLFVLSGISTKSALEKRTNKEYLIERVKRLFIPFCLEQSF